ncbi:MAG: helix-turn-helix domain-containing protein [Clostridiales bacterium]|nr:helix-turn-helix domain-containing protein [Clostridiales bacterium]
MEYNEKLRELRIQNNMSQEQLAEQLHVTRQTVSKWEQGINQPDIYTLKQYATIFNITIDELVCDVERQDNKPEIKRHKASKILFLISTLLYIFSVLVVFILWRFLQDTIPGHYNVDGVIDRYANKAEILLHLISLTVLYAISLSTFLIGKKNLGKPVPNLSTVSYIVIFSTVLAAQIGYLIFMMCLYVPCLIQDSVMSFIYCMVGDLIFVMGIATHPSITPQNTVLGMRTNFTLTNVEAWKKINNVSSICMAVSALIMITINMIFVQFWVALASPAILIITLVAVFIYHEVLRKQMLRNK